MPHKIVFAFLLGVLPTTIVAQQTPCAAAVRELSALSPRRRLAELQVAGQPGHSVIADGAQCANTAVDSASILDRYSAGFAHLSLFAPVVRAAFVRGLADPRDDGPMWTGRGANWFARTGFGLDIGPFHGTLAPDVWTAENAPYDLYPAAIGGRSAFASPWYAVPASIDLPTRFGTQRLKQLDLGETAAWLTAFGIDAGASTSSQRWGPGVRTNIAVGADAPGVPRAFLRTSRPLSTPVGTFSANAFVGLLTESRFFDTIPSNDYRTMRAAVFAWSPGDSSALTIGATHSTMRNGVYFGSLATNHPLTGKPLQLNTVFAEIGYPNEGTRAYFEAGRFGNGPGIRRFLTVPYQGIGYVVGLEHAMKRRSGTLLLDGEAQNVEQPTDIQGDSTQDFYTSSSLLQAWTQRGQLLGSATGPGSNSQWLSIDWITPSWSFGLFGERVRWNEDAFLRVAPAPNRHDVTLRGGARFGYVRYGQELAFELSTGKRLNYLFQNTTFVPGFRTVDVAIPELRITLTPAVRHRP